MSRRALSVLEPWPTVGYLHEFIDCQTNQSFVYDLQEPFRWIADVTVMESFESGTLDLPDFYFTGDDYRYRFEPEARQGFLELLRERFNSGVRHKGRILKWDTVLERKADEVCSFLTEKSETIDFDEPAPILERQDSRELRARILALTQSEAQRIGIGKSTLSHLRRKSGNDGPFRLYGKVIERMGLLR